MNLDLMFQTDDGDLLLSPVVTRAIGTIAFTTWFLMMTHPEYGPKDIRTMVGESFGPIALQAWDEMEHRILHDLSGGAA